MAGEKVTLARPYARAAFAVALEAGRLDEWSRLLHLLAAVAVAPEVSRLLASPSLGKEEKAARIAELCADEIDEEGRRFLAEIARNDRWQLLPEISAEFEVLRAEEQRALDVQVTSAYELAEAESRDLVESLRRRFGREIRLHSRIDPHLLGGIVIRAGDTVIDASLRGRLERLSESLHLA